MLKMRCKCGEIYNFKDEMFGQTVTCPKCNENILVTSNDPHFYLFNRDKYLLNQQHFSIAEKYHVYDENGNPLFSVIRSRKWLKMMLGILIGAAAGYFFKAIADSFLAIIFEQGSSEYLLANTATFLIGVILFVIIFTVIYGKRSIHFYMDDNKKEPILKVEQTNLFQFPSAKYIVLDKNGKLLANLRKNHMYDIFRIRWYWSDKNGKLIAIVKEESIILAILRRFLGSLYGLLRMNFIFKTHDNVTFGEFNRRISLFDKYALDLSGDTNRLYDRKVCVAIGVLLDTGERR